jgi:acetyl esterase/lipase
VKETLPGMKMQSSTSFAAILLALMIAAQSRGAREVVPLWPDLALTAKAENFEPGEIVNERGGEQKHNRSVSKVTHPGLTVFLPDRPDPRRSAIIVCPGGGYAALSVDKEGFDVAARLNEAGIAAFVLKYRLPDGTPPPPNSQPAPIQDVKRAIRTVRKHSAQWNVDPARIGVLGFSAGGHVASTAATQFDAGNAASNDSIERESSRPDFLLLLYPVVSMRGEICHKGSRKNLLGENPSDELIDRYSGELHVTTTTPPMFVVHAADDKSVPIANSRRLVEAATRKGVDATLITLEKGGHGFGLGANGGEAATWFDQMLAWLRAHHVSGDTQTPSNSPR